MRTRGENEVRETQDKIEIQLDARHLVTHSRIAEAEHQRVTLAVGRLNGGSSGPAYIIRWRSQVTAEPQRTQRTRRKNQNKV